jgi:hypothetical protein
VVPAVSSLVLKKQEIAASQTVSSHGSTEQHQKNMITPIFASVALAQDQSSASFIALEHANAALIAAQSAQMKQQLAEPSSYLVAARRVLAHVSECSIMFSDNEDDVHSDLASPSHIVGDFSDVAESHAISQSLLLAASLTAQASIDEASCSARISRYSAHEALLAQASAAISDIPASPASPSRHQFSPSHSQHFTSFNGGDQEDDGDDSRQYTLHHAADACRVSFLETSQLPVSSVSEELEARARSATLIQRAWRRPVAYFDCAMSACESLNCSGGLGLDSLLRADDDRGEVDVEAMSAFDEALNLFELSVGTPRSR